MPGEPLVCVWQLANHSGGRGTTPLVSVTLLQGVVQKLQHLDTVGYSPETFKEYFKDSFYVKFDKFLRYAEDHLVDGDDCYALMEEEIEAKCWDLLRNSLEAIAEKYETTKTRQLWYIFNRLAIEGTLPVAVGSEAVEWLLQRMNSRIKVNKDKAVPSKLNITFEQFLDILFEDCFKGVGKKTAEACIDFTYGWMVEERMQSGWVYVRHRQNANWTDWSKRWASLTPKRLVLTKDSGGKDSTGRKEVIFFPETTLSFDKGKAAPEYPNRFRVQNLPFTESEISAGSYKAWLAWTHDIQVILEEAKSKNTPVQRLIKDLFSTNHKSKSPEEMHERFKNALSLALSLAQGKSDEDSYWSNATVENGVDHTDGDENLIKNTDDQMRAVFMKVDTSGNGVVDFKEFEVFMKSLGLATLDPDEIKMVFDGIDINKNGTLSYDEFADYFADVLANKDSGGARETQLRQAFLQADRDGSGTICFKEVSDYLLQSQQAICQEKIMAAFEKSGGEMSMDKFKEMCLGLEEASVGVIKTNPGDAEEISQMEKRLIDFYSSTDGDNLSQFINDRWKGFAGFKRSGASGELVMTGGDDIVEDFVPGKYNLLEMVCFSDLPPLEPDFSVIKGAQWKSSNIPGKSGKLICPTDFNGQIKMSPATSEFLRYYGCSFAENNSVTVSLMYRHAIQDFTYESAYLEDYVKNKNGGAGVEKHKFVHLDCPMEEDNGHFIIGKFVNESELHLTAFRVPMRHTLYLPPGTIHSNDYLKGSWRTLLSDEANIDHVHLKKPAPGSTKLESFTFEFID